MRADEIAASWIDNAGAWTSAVREGRIASRREATEAAVLDALRALAPARVLDLGCGEGWLCRALAAEGVHCTGTDGSAPLLEAARAAGGGDFVLADYAALAAGDGPAGPFDAIVANFALLDEDIVPLLRSLRGRLASPGHLLIQTVHPLAAGGDYRDGWRTEDFAAFGDAGFRRAMPWFFRSFARWSGDLAAAGYVLAALREPRGPDGQPRSLLMLARPD